MSRRQAYAHVLPAGHRKALKQASRTLIETYFDDLARADERAWDFSSFFIARLLPSGYLLKYDRRFARRFLVCLITAAWKLNQPEFDPFACVAEEIAAYTLVKFAAVLLQEQGIHADFESFIEAIYEDTDFEHLYDAKMDGIEHSPIAEMMGMVHLAFNEWFEPFDPPMYGAVHPYVQ